jgi:hypothetical protein
VNLAAERWHHRFPYNPIHWPTGNCSQIVVAFSDDRYVRAN